MEDTEPEKYISSIRKMSCKELFWPVWMGPIGKRKKVYPGHELYKEHMKGVSDGIIRLDNEV